MILLDKGEPREYASPSEIVLSARRRYAIWQWSNKRKTNVELAMYENGERVGEINASRHPDSDIFKVCYSFCSRRGEGKALYYLLMSYIFPFRLIPDEHNSSDAKRVWAGIAATLKEDEKGGFSFLAKNTCF